MGFSRTGISALEALLFLGGLVQVKFMEVEELLQDLPFDGLVQGLDLQARIELGIQVVSQVIRPFVLISFYMIKG